MATKVIMPQGGQDITEGKVVSWLKSEGDPVKLGEIICEVETEKAVFEVEYSGELIDFCPTANTLGFSSMKKLLALDAWVETCW